MSRPLKLSVMLALALASQYAAAQSLGAVQVKSNLDQPLLAEIPLVSQSPGDTKNVQVALASVEAFARAGIDRRGIPQGVQFAVVDNAKGQPVIRVTTAQPVSEPYIDLLVDVKGGGGTSVVREVTLLLDPSSAPAPVAATPPAARQPTPAATPSAPPPTRQSAPVHPGSSAPAAAPVARAPRTPRTPAETGATLGTVQKGQTLSTYAKQISGNGVDMNQALVALKQANPEAFYRDNINALKAGVVLRAPSSQDLQATAAAEASTQVRRQNDDWRGVAARKATTTVADAAAGNAPSKGGAPTGDDRLALVPAKGNQAGNGKVAAAMTSLQQDLARSQETLTALRQQGEELKSRVDDLENINQKNQRLLSLKDAQIADLQKKLADARKAANLPPAPASAPSPVAAVSTPAPSASAPSHAASTASAAAPAPAASAARAGSAAVLTTTPLAEHTPAASPAAKKPPPHVAPPAPMADQTPWFMQPWVWAVAAGAVVVLLLLAVLGRRRKVAPAAAVAAPSLADRFGDAPLFDEAGIDEDDIDQRELLDELSEHPDDVALHLELVTLYYDRRDVDHFEAAAEAMYAHVVDVEQDEWQDVVRMGEDLTPQHPLFAHGASSAVQPAHDTGDLHDDAALEAFDVNRYASEDEHLHDAPSPASPAPQKLSEYHFNFDLSPPPRASGHAAVPLSARDDFDLGPHVDQPLPANEQELPPHEEAANLHLADAEEEAANSSWKFDAPATAPADAFDVGAENFSDDPVDTKLDLARAYLDMGDADGARAMLDEVVAEGTQMQQDVARKMLADLH